MTKQIELLIAHESWQIPLAREHVARGAQVVCLNFFVERELKKQNIPFISLRDIVDSETGEEEWWLLAQEVAREWYRLPRMAFFEHDGIRIGEVVGPIFEEYLSRLFYYVRFYIALKEKFPNAHLTIPMHIVEGESPDNCLIAFERRIVADAARIARLSVQVLNFPIPARKPPFSVTVLKPFFVRMYNLAMTFVSVFLANNDEKRIKIFAGEYWSHIAPIIEKMDGVDLVLMESDALLQIPWRHLLARSVRVRHPHVESAERGRRRATEVAEHFRLKWETAKKDVAAYLTHTRRDLDLSPVLDACTSVVGYAVYAVADIDATRRSMEEERPDVVLQSASLGGRHHYFFIMARIAAKLQIPSIELQHGINTVDPRQEISRVETDYLATYGTYTNSGYERIGYSRDRLVAIGSTRFDTYIHSRIEACKRGKQILKRLELDAARPVMLVAVPFQDANPVTFDSYQLAEYYQAIRTAQRTIPGVQILFKFRRNKYIGATRAYLDELFQTDYAIVGNEDLFPLLCASDAVVSGNSTVIYETMLAQKPLILYPWKSFDTYNERVLAPGAPLAHTAEEFARELAKICVNESYRRELLERQKQFLGGYSFDGKASECMVDLLRRVARK